MSRNIKEVSRPVLTWLKGSTLALSVLTCLSCSLSCSQTSSQKHAEESAAEATTQDTSAYVETYQHIAMATIKDEKWDDYLSVMQRNIASSRQETGNVLFTLFQPEDGTHQVAWVERFKNKPAFEEHLKSELLPLVEKTLADAKAGEIVMHELKEIPEVPAVEPVNADDISSPRNVIVFFDVKPEKRQTFIDAIAEVTPHARQAKGNARFNLFQYQANENKFVLVESWESIAHHEFHLAQDYSKKLDATIDGIFVSNPADARWLAQDISK